MTTYISNDQVC